MNWENAVKKLRSKMQISQEDFAKELGVSFASVNRWERGHFEPTIKCKKEIKKMCDKYQIYSSFDDDDVFQKCLQRLKNKPLMKQALTDSSYKKYQQKHKLEEKPNNFVLATYGDAVLKLAFCELLFDDENLTTTKSRYENDRVLVEVIGKHYKILDLMNMDKEDENMPNDYVWNPIHKNSDNKEDTSHKRIATCLEAIIGAIYKIGKDMDEIADIALYWKNLIDSQSSLS